MPHIVLMELILKTPYEKLKGKKSGVKMVPFGEVVHFQPVFHSRDRIGDKLRPNFIYGVYVGIDSRSSAHICLTAEGAMYTRSVKRQPEGSRYDGDFLGKVRGTPWDFNAEPGGGGSGGIPDREDKSDIPIVPQEARDR